MVDLFGFEFATSKSAFLGRFTSVGFIVSGSYLVPISFPAQPGLITCCNMQKAPDAEGANCCHNLVYEALSNSSITIKGVTCILEEEFHRKAQQAEKAARRQEKQQAAAIAVENVFGAQDTSQVVSALPWESWTGMLEF